MGQAMARTPRTRSAVERGHDEAAHLIPQCDRWTFIAWGDTAGAYAAGNAAGDAVAAKI